MKQLCSLFLLFFLTVSVLSANNKTSDAQMIQKLIEKVKKSKKDERRKAMNELKIKLRSMNQETRRSVMMHLKESFVQNSQDTSSNTSQPLQRQGAGRTSDTGHISQTIFPQHQKVPYIQRPNTVPVPSRQPIPVQHTPNHKQYGGPK